MRMPRDLPAAHGTRLCYLVARPCPPSPPHRHVPPAGQGPPDLAEIVRLARQMGV
ncbi:hypothetical protein ACFQZ4_25440 [Catellatospora coxensis]